MLNIPDIIELWPSSAELARRIGEKPIVVHRWKARERIPGTYDVKLVEQAKTDGIDLSFQMLAQARVAPRRDQSGHSGRVLQAPTDKPARSSEDAA